MFRDRLHAAELLVPQLKSLHLKDSLVLAIPRGGLPMGAYVARALKAPLQVLFAKKIGHPENPEYAIGAATVEDSFIEDHNGISPVYIQEEVTRIQQLLQKRIRQYGITAPADYRNKDVIILDDGIATGRTIKACIKMIRKNHPSSITVAVPVAPFEVVNEMVELCDNWICLYEAKGAFPGVGAFYSSFDQVSDEEAAAILSEFI